MWNYSETNLDCYHLFLNDYEYNKRWVYEALCVCDVIGTPLIVISNTASHLNDFLTVHIKYNTDNI